MKRLIYSKIREAAKTLGVDLSKEKKLQNSISDLQEQVLEMIDNDVADIVINLAEKQGIDWQKKIKEIQ